MMFGTMWETGLYPPIYLTQPRIERQAVLVHLLNENRPSLWEQVSDYIEKHGSIGNPEVRQLVGGGDVLAASKQLRRWVARGQLVVLNPNAAKQLRSYAKPGTPAAQTFLSQLEEP